MPISHSADKEREHRGHDNNSGVLFVRSQAERSFEAVSWAEVGSAL